MSYHVRVFGERPQVPPLADLFESAGAAGVGLSLDPEWVDDVDVLDPAWSEAAVVHDHPSAVTFWTIDRAATGEEGATFEEERADFIDALEDVGDTPDRRRVVEHLRKATFLFAARIPLAAHDDALRGVQAVCDHLLERCGGVIQADAEGFYLDGELRVPLD